jgi:hypothetical protein
MAIGVPELTILIVVVTGLVPIAAAVWALVMLYRVRSDVHATRGSLERIEQLLQRR